MPRNDVLLDFSEQTQQLNFQELGHWIKKHSMLYNKLGGFNYSNLVMKWHPFVRLYYDLLDLWSYISKYINEITEANSIIKQIDEEQDIINWVVKYETLYKEAPLLVLIGFEHNGNDIHTYDKQIMLLGDEFSKIFSFERSYSENHYNLLKKYYIYTAQEEAEMYNEENIRNEKPNLHSLNFHLEQRKAMEELGKNLPFNL